MAESWASEDEAEAHCSRFCEKNALIIELAAAARTNYTFGLVVSVLRSRYINDVYIYDDD